MTSYRYYDESSRNKAHQWNFKKTPFEKEAITINIFQ